MIMFVLAIDTVPQRKRNSHKHTNSHMGIVRAVTWNFFEPLDYGAGKRRALWTPSLKPSAGAVSHVLPAWRPPCHRASTSSCPEHCNLPKPPSRSEAEEASLHVPGQPCRPWLQNCEAACEAGQKEKRPSKEKPGGARGSSAPFFGVLFSWCRGGFRACRIAVEAAVGGDLLLARVEVSGQQDSRQGIQGERRVQLSWAQSPQTFPTKARRRPLAGAPFFGPTSRAWRPSRAWLPGRTDGRSVTFHTQREHRRWGTWRGSWLLLQTAGPCCGRDKSPRAPFGVES